MLWMLIGLVLFLGLHSSTLFYPTIRQRLIDRTSEGAYLGAYSLLSAVGLVLIIWGYGQSRLDPVFIWHPPLALYAVTLFLTLIAFLFLTATYIPHNHLKKLVGHPMIISVKIWAFAHLLANGRLSELLLFGAFLAWAIIYYAINRRRDRAASLPVPTANLGATLLTVVIGSVVWVVFALWLHRWFIGVSPFGA